MLAPAYLERSTQRYNRVDQSEEAMANKKGATGGAAAAGGIEFQAYGAAWAGARLLVGNHAKLPWALPDGVTIRRVECEQDTEVDDVLLHLSTNGTVYLQFKLGLTLGQEFDKAVAQMVRQYHAPKFSASDRLVIFTNSTASGTVRIAIKGLLDRLRDDRRTSVDSTDFSIDEETAFTKLKKSVHTCWPSHSVFDEEKLTRFLISLHVTVMDLQAPEIIVGTRELLSRVTSRDGDVWSRLVSEALSAARKRAGFDRLSLWEMLRQDNVEISLANVGLPNGTYIPLSDVMTRMTREIITSRENLQTFNAQRFVVRTALDLEWRTFCASDARLLVLTGQSGHGKTTALTHYSAVHPQRTLLIRGEDLQEQDEDVRASITRLVIRFCSSNDFKAPREHDILQWLAAADLLLIVDGLDRSTLSPGAANRWVSGSLAWLSQAKTKLVLSTRPESWSIAGEVLARVPWLMYRDEEGNAPLILGMFTQEEAEKAAVQLDRPDLARYTHPGMMSLAAVLVPGQTPLQRHCDVINRYLDFLTHQINNVAGSTTEEVALFLSQVAGLFVRSDSGSLRVSTLQNLIRESGVIYRAVRKTNLLVSDYNDVRFYPDEVGEHLQARELDVDVELGRIDEILNRPIRLGILRSAVVQADSQDRSTAREYFRKLIDCLDGRRSKHIRTLCTAIALELRDWDGYKDLLIGLVRSWDRQNSFLSTDPIVAILSSSRWSVSERIALLWEIVWNENGYDWRSKHWLRPEYAPNFRITIWASLMEQAIVESRISGLKFLMQYFDAKGDLQCSEANLGDLAQGLFYRAARTLTKEALDLLFLDPNASSKAMMRYLCDGYSAESLAWLSSRLSELSDEVAIRYLNNIRPSASLELYLNVGQTLLARVRQGKLRSNCLISLIRGNHLFAAEELSRAFTLGEAEITELLCTRGKVFSVVSAILFERMAVGTLSSEIFSGIYLSGLRQGESEELLMHIEGLISKEPRSISYFAYMLEGLTYNLYRSEVLPAPLHHIMRTLLTHGSNRARKHLIYACTNSKHSRPISEAGLIFQRQLLAEVLVTESHVDNLYLLVKILSGEEPDSNFARETIALLCQRFPQLDLMALVHKTTSYEV
jgi:hypothetical protein